MNIYMICTLWTPWLKGTEKIHTEEFKFQSNIYSILFASNIWDGFVDWFNNTIVHAVYTSWYKKLLHNIYPLHVLYNNHYIMFRYHYIMFRYHYIMFRYQYIMFRYHYIMFRYHYIMFRYHYSLIIRTLLKNIGF